MPPPHHHSTSLLGFICDILTSLLVASKANWKWVGARLIKNLDKQKKFWLWLSITLPPPPLIDPRSIIYPLLFLPVSGGCEWDRFKCIQSHFRVRVFWFWFTMDSIHTPGNLTFVSGMCFAVNKRSYKMILTLTIKDVDMLCFKLL